MSWWPGSPQEGRPAGDPRARWPPGCVQSPEDCSHASQLRQQRLQLQPLPSPWQTGRVPPFPAAHLLILGRGVLGARATGPHPGSPRRSEEVAGGRSALSQDMVFAAKPHLLAKTLLRHPSHPSPFPSPLPAGPAPLPLPCAPTPWSFLGSQEENAHQGTVVSQRKGCPLSPRREAPR